jgi:hypothetical protein
MLSTILVLAALILGFVSGWVSGRKTEREQCKEDILRFQRLKKAEMELVAEGKPVSWLGEK